MVSPSRILALRLSLFYAAYFAFIGVNLPFWPVWLEANGMSTREIALLLAVGISIKVVGNPVVAHVADRLGERRRLMIWLMVAAVVSFLGFALVDGFWPYLLVTGVFFLAWSVVMPLGESLTMLSASSHGLDYGRIRLWGSLSFIVAAVGAGHLLVRFPPSVIYWLLVVALVAAVGSGLLLPDIRAPRPEGKHRPLRVLARDRRFVVFVVAATLIQSSHAAYYAFSTLHWRSVGYSEDVIGLLWGEGVAAEVILFAFGARVIGWTGPARLIALGGVAALIRWSVTGVTDALPALVVVQALHAVSFGATHLGAIHYIARRVPPTLSATAQSVYAAAVMGIGMGLAIWGAGFLYARFAGGVFLAMAVMGAVGLALAVALHRMSRGATAAGSTLQP